jgi:hypothetical protein
MKNHVRCSSIVSFLANTVTFSLQKTLLFLAGFIIFYSCATYKYQLVEVKIISLQGYTMKGYKYYVTYNNKFDSIYYKDNNLVVGMYYPFNLRQK